MNKEIKFSGLSAVPSDYESPDGQLSLSLNLLNETGSLAPLFPPKVLFALDPGSEVIFVHKPSGLQHFIIRAADGSLKFTDLEAASLSDIPGTLGSSVSHIDAVGNTLLVFSSSAITYYLWTDGAYKRLGTSLPDIQISFGLVGRPRLYSVSDDSKSTFNISFDSIPASDINGTFSEANKSKITSQVMAKVNKFIAAQTVNKGRFCFPFLVRFALRLYDGSLTCHSAPVLMNPSTSTCPIVLWRHIKGKSSYTDAELDIMLVAASLDFQAMLTDGLARIDDWSDIVKGVEVFISKPIYTFDSEGECSSFYDSDNFETKFIGRLFNANDNRGENTGVFSVSEDKFLRPTNPKEEWENFYAEWEYSKIYALYFSPDRSYPGKTLALPEFSADKVAETIRNTSTFYKLYSIDIPSLKASASKRTDIVVDDEYLRSLVAREVMTDDYLSHDVLRADSSFVYNSRLNLAGVKRRLFPGFYLASMLAYKNTDFNWDVENSPSLSITSSLLHSLNYTVTTYIKENNRDYAVVSYFNGLLGSGFPLGRVFSATNTVSNQRERHSWGCYLFYPNVAAYRMVIQSNQVLDDGDGFLYQPRLVVDLSPHDFLNGAFAFLDYDRVVLDNFSADKVPSFSSNPNVEKDVVDVPNKIFTSEVNNPFFFPVTGINTIGAGRILGICSAAKALSQGQFGQFPLYAFTSEGVWALEVSASGGFSARQPITRDVCISASSITQIDSAVLFATSRGIMLISGSQTQCITDALNAPEGFSLSSLPGFCARFPEVECSDLTFSKFIADCRIAYDYVNRRILLFRPSSPVAFVYSLKSQLWGMQESSLSSVINSYPEAYAMAYCNGSPCLVDIARSDTDSVRVCLVSRPVKFDAPDILKTLNVSLLRGFLPSRADADASILVYGSRDFRHWHLVGASRGFALRTFRGSPYKAFRVVALLSLSPSDSVAGCSFDITPRLTNQLR